MLGVTSQRTNYGAREQGSHPNAKVVWRSCMHSSAVVCGPVNHVAESIGGACTVEPIVAPLSTVDVASVKGFTPGRPVEHGTFFRGLAGLIAPFNDPTISSSPQLEGGLVLKHGVWPLRLLPSQPFDWGTDAVLPTPFWRLWGHLQCTIC